MRNTMIAPALGLLVLLSGCATAGERGPGSSRDVLEAEEIESAGVPFRTAFDAVEGLRPNFLNVRMVPGYSSGPVRVYVNGVSRGGPDALRGIRVEEILRIRYLRSQDAQTRYGLDHRNGALEVTLRRH